MAKKQGKNETPLAKRLRKLAAKLGYTHDQLAREIGVATITLRTWLYSRHEPSTLATKAIDALCELHGIKK